MFLNSMYFSRINFCCLKYSQDKDESNVLKSEVYETENVEL